MVNASAGISNLPCLASYFPGCADDSVIPPSPKLGHTFYTLYMYKNVMSLFYNTSNMLLKFLIKK